MICGNTSDFIDHPLPKHFVSAHGASHRAWAPGLPQYKFGAVVFATFGKDFFTLCLFNSLNGFREKLKFREKMSWRAS